MLKTPPIQYEYNDQANESKEVLNFWARNVGVEKGVLVILDDNRGPDDNRGLLKELKEEMMDYLWELHQVMEDIEVNVGSRRIRSDGLVVQRLRCPYRTD